MFTFIIIFIYMILFPVTTIVTLFKILEGIEELKEKETKKSKNKIVERREHSSIGSTNYKSVFNRRNSIRDYDIYKNGNKLYEPVTPHKPGVKIHEKED